MSVPPHGHSRFPCLSDLIVPHARHNQASDVEKGKSLVVSSLDENTEVGLVRLGPDKGRVSLQYKTVVMSAVPGKHYKPVRHLPIALGREVY